jgi:hypothetical protein
VSESEASARRSSTRESRWRVGYWLLFGAMVVFGTELTALAPIALLPLVVLFTGVPHYGATLLRVCERPGDRRAYSRVTIAASVIVLAALAASLRDVFLGSLLLTIYLTWSPWHYSGQNYGVTLMMLGRRGVAIEPGTKRWLHASFLLSFALVVLSINGATPGGDYAPVSYGGTVFHHLTLGMPDWIHTPLLTAVAAAYAASLCAAGAGLLRGGTPRDVAPATAVVLSQSLWFAIPALARLAGVFQETGPLSPGMAAYAFMWVGVAHSVQYLWVTSYFAARSSGAPATPRGGAGPFLLRYTGKVLAAGAALWVIPALVFAPGALGTLPFDAGLAVMISAAINIHHFSIDGVIWKLRDGRISRVLLRGQAGSANGDGDPSKPTPGARRMAGTLAWAAGGICVIVFGGAVVEQEHAR